jgi:hypothetical protein
MPVPICWCESKRDWHNTHTCIKAQRCLHARVCVCVCATRSRSTRASTLTSFPPLSLSPFLTYTQVGGAGAVCEGAGVCT